VAQLRQCVPIAGRFGSIFALDCKNIFANAQDFIWSLGEQPPTTSWGGLLNS